MTDQGLLQKENNFLIRDFQPEIHKKLGTMERFIYTDGVMAGITREAREPSRTQNFGDIRLIKPDGVNGTGIVANRRLHDDDMFAKRPPKAHALNHALHSGALVDLQFRHGNDG